VIAEMAPAVRLPSSGAMRHHLHRMQDAWTLKIAPKRAVLTVVPNPHARQAV
jgi:hypothetical protein